MKYTRRLIVLSRLSPILGAIAVGYTYGLLLPRPYSGVKIAAWWVLYVCVSYLGGIATNYAVRRLVKVDLGGFEQREHSEFRNLLSRYRCTVGRGAILAAAEGRPSELHMQPEQAEGLLELIERAQAHHPAILRSGQNIAAVSELIATELQLNHSSIDRIRIVGLLQPIGLCRVDRDLIAPKRQLVPSEQARVNRALQSGIEHIGPVVPFLGKYATLLTSQPDSSLTLEYGILTVATRFDELWTSGDCGAAVSASSIVDEIRRSLPQIPAKVTDALESRAKLSRQRHSGLRSLGAALLQPAIFGVNAPIAAALAPAMLSTGGAAMLPPDHLAELGSDAVAVVTESVSKSHETDALPTDAVQEGSMFEVAIAADGKPVVTPRAQSTAYDPTGAPLATLAPSASLPIDTIVDHTGSPDTLLPTIPQPTQLVESTTTQQPEAPPTTPLPIATAFPSTTGFVAEGGLIENATTTAIVAGPPPVRAEDDKFEAKRFELTMFDVLANDFVAEGATVTLRVISPPARGVARVSNGKIAFLGGWKSGPDRLVYKLCVGDLCSQATVTFNVVSK